MRLNERQRPDSLHQTSSLRSLSQHSVCVQLLQARIMASQKINAVYYPSWRVYKDIPPSKLPAEKITHVFYAFAKSVSLPIQPQNRLHLTS